MYSYLGAIYGWFLVTKAQAPMFGYLAMLASVRAVVVVSLLTVQRQRALVDKIFTAGPVKE